jgi:hypothetical protein
MSKLAELPKAIRDSDTAFVNGLRSFLETLNKATTLQGFLAKWYQLDQATFTSFPGCDGMDLGFIRSHAEHMMQMKASDLTSMAASGETEGVAQAWIERFVMRHFGVCCEQAYEWQESNMVGTTRVARTRMAQRALEGLPDDLAGLVTDAMHS